MKIEDRIRGGLYGMAVGDALGGTTEFMTRAEIAGKYGRLTEIIGGGVWDLEPGEVTDDTMMTLCVGEGLLENPGEPMDSIGRRFLTWYHSDPKDIGNIIRRTLQRYEGNWFEAAFTADHDLGGFTAGNGALMRCLPVALAYPGLPELERITRMQSKMTHWDERSSEACVLYNRIARRLLQGEGLRAAASAETAGTMYAEACVRPPDCQPTGYVVDTLQWVLHLVTGCSTFEEVVQEAAALGGDTDTIGAIAGGLAGVYYGVDGIPARYREAILIRERLEQLAAGLAERRADSAGPAAG